MEVSDSLPTQLPPARDLFVRRLPHDPGRRNPRPTCDHVEGLAEVGRPSDRPSHTGGPSRPAVPILTHLFASTMANLIRS